MGSIGKLSKKACNFYDITELDLNSISSGEMEPYARDTLAVLNKYKKSKKNANFTLMLVAGLLALRGGEFTKITLFKTKYRKGDCTKQELRIIRKAFFNYKVYLVFKIFIVLLSHGENKMTWVNPHIAKRK